MGRGGGKGRVWKTKEGIMKTSGIVDRGEDTFSLQVSSNLCQISQQQAKPKWQKMRDHNTG